MKQKKYVRIVESGKSDLCLPFQETGFILCMFFFFCKYKLVLNTFTHWFKITIDTCSSIEKKYEHNTDLPINKLFAKQTDSTSKLHHKYFAIFLCICCCTICFYNRT